MKTAKGQSLAPPSAPKLPNLGTDLTGDSESPPKVRPGAPKSGVVKWNGREIPLVMQDGVWRMRSRSKEFPVNFYTGCTDLVDARRKCREYLDGNPVVVDRTKGTLEEACSVYLSIPRKCTDDTAEGNVSRLRNMVALVHRASLDAVPVSSLPTLWPSYVALRQGRTVPDYATRRSENAAIASALRQAASIFREKLRPSYAAAGVVLPPNAGQVEFPPSVKTRPPKADEAGLVEAWEGLEAKDKDLWLVIGLARFAGLRQSEILACRGKWIVRRSAGAVVEVQDREEDSFLTKTGRIYLAPVLHQRLADYLLALNPEDYVIQRPDAQRWIARAPQDWLRPFTGASRMPLHRLRGLYADHLSRETAEAVLARQAGIKAASEALGHTTTSTTEKHYLS